MPNIILQPAGGEEAFKHYNKTIIEGVTLDSISNRLNDKEKKALSIIYKNTKMVS